MNGVRNLINPIPDDSRSQNANANKNGNDDQDDLKCAATGLGGRSCWLESGWLRCDRLEGGWLNRRIRCAGGRRRCAARTAGLLVGGYFSSTFRTEVSHDDLLVLAFLSGTATLLSRLAATIPHDGSAGHVFLCVSFAAAWPHETCPLQCAKAGYKQGNRIWKLSGDLPRLEQRA